MSAESEAIAGARQRVISPVDGSVYAEFDPPSGAEIETTVERAFRAQAAWKRVHGAAALEERWLGQQLDLRDPSRPEADLG